jgi:RimJ/RimL family protein N-acetyltransferase
MDDLVTERLVLHLLTVEEAERVAAGTPGDGDRWAAGYPSAGDVTGASKVAKAYAEGGDPGAFGSYEIRRREDGCAIGGIGFHGPPDEAGTVTIGYSLIPSVRGSGYASEALREIVRFARTQGVGRVKGDADLGNVASHRVMVAAGMRLVAEDERLKYFEVGWAE